MSNTQTIPAVLQEAIDRNPDWRGRNIEVSPVPGGITNENFRIRVDGGQPIFSKIPGVGTEKFIKRSTAHQAAVQAAEAGISPKVIYFDNETEIEFSEFIEKGYRTATTLDFQDFSVLKSVMAVYRKWHETDLLDETKTMIDMVEEHLQQVREDGIELPIWADEVLGNYSEAVESLTKNGLDLVPAHNDPMPGNFLVDQHQNIKLIDFDYAANNEKTYELGLLLAEMFINVDRSRRLVSEYLGEFDQRFFARAMLGRMIADTKWGLWGLINAHVRDEDFDYYKYGSWKLFRTFWVSRQRDYRAWLKDAV